MSEKSFHTIYSRVVFVFLLLCTAHTISAQKQYELNSGWHCIKASSLKNTGEEISTANFPLAGWMPAVVPGTVLTSQLHNKLIPDPFYGMNNKRIPDIYDVGRDYYTYWFVKDLTEKALNDEYVWLQFRGVNNSFDVYLNGHKVNDHRDNSMYLRHEYNITPFLSKDGRNRLAVIVFPPDPVGNPNGGQGGDGTIAHNITNQYTAGWDWIQPVHDRNTGIWDKVFIKKTKQVKISNTHIVTLVPGIRTPHDQQAPAIIQVTAELENPGNIIVSGTLQYSLDGKIISVHKQIPAHTKVNAYLPDLTLNNPRLWWPNGYGPQNLYNLTISFIADDKTISDAETISFGVRELQAVWNTHTESRELHVNGQKIFVKGGNWICSDEMMRCSKERYDAEVRYHHDMNLNLIRVWGGGLTERPEFYDACDKYGLLVMQDFWVSGDCNGRWYDPLKLDDTNARRKYPDDHKLLVASMADQVLMLRNHPSLAYWCGGNEIRPPADVLVPLRDSILPKLDGTRFFFEHSNDDSMSLAAHDGPYTIQPDTFFWSHRSWGLNSEVGSVGIGDYESLQRFIPVENMVLPRYDATTRKWLADSVWQYHKYVSYDSSIEAYGHPRDVNDFAMKAQLVNYNQYRALMEGAAARMWDWYTGIIEWKTQNPWTAMVGQMYDVYLDPNACMYGLQEGSKQTHIMYDPVHNCVNIVNNHALAMERMVARLLIFDADGKEKLSDDQLLPFSTATDYGINSALREWRDSICCSNRGLFLYLGLYVVGTDSLYDENMYWLPDATGKYSGLMTTPVAKPGVTAKVLRKGVVSVTLSNAKDAPMAFFNRISVVDKKTKKRILPVFCNNNYISILPGQKKTLELSFTPQQGMDPMVCIEGWNVEKQYIEIKH